MLSFDNISFSFGKTKIFENLSLDFHPGKMYGIVGANGVGKTTLFRSIAGLYPLKSGKIMLKGHSLKSNHVSFLPTDPFFYPYMNGMEYFQIIQQNEHQLSHCIKLAEVLNIPLNNLVDTYSTGMKKKLAFIARYTQLKPVDIYDEPFNGVDLESNEILMNLLQKNNEDKITLISSHILSMLFEMCDEIIHIEKEFMVTTYGTENFDQLKNKIRSTI